MLFICRKPSNVVPQHRNRAIVVWVAILITAVGYTVWQTTVVIRKRQNPSTKLLVSNQQYQFPLVSVCLDDGLGCGYSDGSIDGCVASALVASAAWYNEYDDFVFPSQGQSENCVEFDLTQFQVPEGERESAAGVSATIAMDWISSDNATAETDYSAGVNVILGDSGSYAHGEEESMMVPYSRNEASSNDRNYETTALTIGKTNRKYLSGTSITNYPVLTISTTRFVTTKAWDIFRASSSTSAYSSYSSSWKVTNDSAYGSLYLDITQGSYSHTNVEDIEPLEIGALFGNVGGFWELLVLAWGVFFITKSRDTEPTLKARNFAKVLQRGDPTERKRRRLDSAAAEEAGHDGPRPPGWDSSDDDEHYSNPPDSGACEQCDRSRRHRTHRSARPRRPVAHPPSRRASFHSEPSRVGISVQSRRNSASAADGTLSAMQGTKTSRRSSGSHVAGAAASKFNTYDAGMAEIQRTAFTVNVARSGSVSKNPDGGDGGKARISFFPATQSSASRIQIHPDSEDELSQSSRSATRPADEANGLVESGEDAGGNDLELGYGSESAGRHAEA